MKTGYFFKDAKINDDNPISYNNEKMYSTPEKLIQAILEKAMKSEFELLCEQRDDLNEHITPEVNKEEYNSIKEEIMNSIKKCKDALSICNTIRTCLYDYEETCGLFLDIGFTSTN